MPARRRSVARPERSRERPPAGPQPAALPRPLTRSGVKPAANSTPSITVRKAATPRSLPPANKIAPDTVQIPASGAPGHFPRPAHNPISSTGNRATLSSHLFTLASHLGGRAQAPSLVRGLRPRNAPSKTSRRSQCEGNMTLAARGDSRLLHSAASSPPTCLCRRSLTPPRAAQPPPHRGRQDPFILSAPLAPWGQHPLWVPSRSTKT